MSHWLAEGRSLGASLRRFTSLVVAGPDRGAAAEVALGVAESQAGERRVVLADLLDDSPRFAALRTHDDHHGIVDTLHYGVSLARIARPVPNNERLLFAPTGSEITDYAELLSNPRWTRLIESFARSSDLLVVAVPADAAGLDELVRHTDGIIVVDGQVPARIDTAQVVAQVRARPAAPLPTVKRPSVPVVPAGSAAVMASPGAIRRPPPPTPAPPRPSVKVQPPPPKEVVTAGTAAGKRIPGLDRRVVVGALVTLVVALFIYWLAERPAAEPDAPIAAVAQPQAGAGSGAAPSPNLPDPADSGGSPFAVQITTANTQTAAILKLKEHQLKLPAATYSPVSIQGTTWFRVLAGAFQTQSDAQSMLATLRSSGVLDSTEGMVVHVPFSLRIDSVQTATVEDYLAQLRGGRNLPAYALMQRDGWVWIMVGAFENERQASTYAQPLRAVSGGLTFQIVRRKGRTF